MPSLYAGAAPGLICCWQYPLVPKQPDLILQLRQKPARMRAVHLRVMELERKGQIIPKPFLLVSAPYRNHFFLYLPQMMNGLLNMPLFIPTAPSISVSIMADVPMTILFSDNYCFKDIIICHSTYYNIIASINIISFSAGTYKIQYRRSQELTSPSLFFTIVLTAMVSYCMSLSPTGRI